MEFTKSVALFVLTLILLLVQKNVAEKRSVYIVQMDKPSMPKAFSTPHYWYSSILKSAQSAAPNSLHEKPDPELIYTYDHAFHGFSALMSEDELQALKESDGFISVYADHAVTLDTTRSTEFLSLNSANGLWPASQYGKDVIIGVIDTGIWPESPSFRDDGMGAVPARWRGSCQGGDGFPSSSCNRKLIGARYFNRGVQASMPNVPNTARDHGGHGTHVASIAAGNYVNGVSFFGYAPGTARGVAPRACIAAYRVVFREGATSSDVLAGIDQAVADGVDILSISLGIAEVNLYESPLAIASYGAREKGILVSFSAGNTGPGARTIVEKGIPWAVIVGAGTVDRWLAGTITLGNGRTVVGWTTLVARAVVPNLPLFYNPAVTACTSTQLAAVPPNSIIVCNIGSGNENALISVMRSLSSSNMRAAIIIADSFRVYWNSFINLISFPVALISSTQAREVINYASTTSAPRARITFQQTVIGAEPRAASALSDFSSRGPAQSYEGILKPDLIAPGVSIVAAYIPQILISGDPNIGNITFSYNLLSGTSMACPHVSGVAALLKAAHPNWSPSAIQSAMMTTANPLDNTNQPIKDITNFLNTAATPLGIGSGMVDPNRALNPGLIYDASVQDFVNLVCSMGLTPAQIQSLLRTNNYDCSNPSSDLNYPSFVALFSSRELGTTVIRTFLRTVTYVGNGAATYTVNVVAPPGTVITVVPQTLSFSSTNEKGTYVLIVRFTPTANTGHIDGSITWIENSGRHTVRSPIMISPAFNPFLSQETSHQNINENLVSSI